MSRADCWDVLYDTYIADPRAGTDDDALAFRDAVVPDLADLEEEIRTLEAQNDRLREIVSTVANTVERAVKAAELGEGPIW